MAGLEDGKQGIPVIRVIGVGGAGGNAINTMIESGLEGVELIAVNTDVHELSKCKASKRLQIGESLTRGLGAGSHPQLGQQSATQDREKLLPLIEGADMIFIVAGLGGGTGTGASPVIAEIARNDGALTAALVTRPFYFEGRVRAAKARDGLKELRNSADSLIVIPNQRVLELVDRSTSLVNAFNISNNLTCHIVRNISSLITGGGFISIDFADMRTIMAGSGNAIMGVGEASGEGKAEKAAEKAINSPLLECPMETARKLLVNILGNSDLGMKEVEEVMRIVHDAVDPDAAIIFGVIIDPDLGNSLRVTVIATSLDS
jgi:cell division protein FtsZ